MNKENIQVYANGSWQESFLGTELANDGQSLRVATKLVFIYIYIAPFYFATWIFSWKLRFRDVMF